MKNKLILLGFFLCSCLLLTGWGWQDKSQDMQPKSFNDGNDTIKIKWTSGSFDYQVIARSSVYEVATDQGTYHINAYRQPTEQEAGQAIAKQSGKDTSWADLASSFAPPNGIVLRFLDKDGFEVLNNGLENTDYTTEQDGNKEIRIYRGNIICDARDYKRVTSAKVEFK